MPRAQTEPMLQVIHSNRLETLVETLVDALAGELAGKLTPGDRAARGDPFEPDLIVVPNQGMARRLSQQLAVRNGLVRNRPHGGRMSLQPLRAAVARGARWVSGCEPPRACVACCRPAFQHTRPSSP
ncbi:Exonuclease V gamma subunit [Thiorhodovibrio winogradskyi]|uniref:Exonuclease V gamma subunit n=2 Tax=Thiorhodovibrio winogradskyi TaxID=77007 RepID=A0ABZ0SBW4_9GAMM